MRKAKSVKSRFIKRCYQYLGCTVNVSNGKALLVLSQNPCITGKFKPWPPEQFNNTEKF